MESEDRGRRKGPPMAKLEAAARRLGIPGAELTRRLAELGIAIVGRGNRARITQADIQSIQAAVLTIGGKVRVLPPVRSVAKLRLSYPAATVPPVRPKPKR